MIAALLTSPLLVDFSCRPTALSELTPQLAKAFAAEVVVATDLQNEVLAIEAESVQPRVLRAKIADVVCGKWEENPPGRWRLSIDEDEEKRREEAVAKRYADAFRERVKRWKSSNQSMGSAPWDARQLAIDLTNSWNSRLRARLPAEALSLELMDFVSPESVARAAMGDPFVMSNRANRFALPLGAAADEVIERRTKQSLELSEMFKSIGWAPTRELPSTLTASRYQKYIPWPNGPYTVVYRSGDRITAFYLNGFVIADLEGRQLESPSGSLGVASLLADKAAHSRLFTSPFASLLKFQLKPQELRASFEAGRYLLDEPEFDPLAMAYGNRWQEFAKAEEASLCLNLPDELALVYLDRDAWQFERNSETNAFTKLASLEVKVARSEDGWITGVAEFPRALRQSRIPREKLKELDRLAATGRYPTIREQLHDAGLFEAMSRAGDVVVTGWHFDVNGESANDLLFNLSPGFLSGAEAGVNCTLGDLSGSDRLLIERTIVESGDWFQPSEDPTMFLDPALIFAETPANEFQVELALANPSRTLIALRFLSDDDHALEIDGVRYDLRYQLIYVNQEMLEAMSEVERQNVIVVGQRRAADLTLRIEHPTKGYRVFSLPIWEGEWKV